MMTLAHSTRIAVQVVVDDDTGNVAALVMALAGLISLLVGLGRAVNQVVIFLDDLAGAGVFVGKVYVIGFKALVFGFTGVSL